MIPILYDYNELTFTSNGLGRLSDCLSCTVTEERNGRFDLEFTYPITGLHFDDILEGRIIAVTHDESGDVQPFVIYQSSKPLDGVVTFNAYHISYRLGQYATLLYKLIPTTCQQILTDLANMSQRNNETWTFTTDITASTPEWVPDSTTGPFRSVREYLGGMNKSVLDTFGGEYEFDKWTVNLWKNRGSNNGVSIRYGKNLTDFKAETDYSGSYSHIVAYYSGDHLTGLAPPFPEKANNVVTIIYDTGHTLPGGRVAELIIDLSDKIENGDTKTDAAIQTELRAAAAAYATNNKVWEPAVSIDVDFVQLWQTEEYKDFAPLLTCKLCDSVNVSFPFYGLADMAIKIVSVEWDALNDRYIKMTLGGLATTLSQSINSGVSGSIQANADVIKAVNSRSWVRDVYVNGSSVVTDEVATLTVPSEPTIQSGTVSGSYTGSINYLKFGRMVIFGGTIGTTGALSNGTQVATGLPANNNNGTVFYALNNNSTSENVPLYVTNTGTLLVRGSFASSSRSLRVSGAYISAS